MPEFDSEKFLNAINQMSASFDAMSKSLLQASNEFLKLLLDIEALDPRFMLTTHGYWMYCIIRWWRPDWELLDSLAWLEQFPGAFKMDFGDGYEL